MRDVILFASVTGAHFIATVALVVYTFGAGMARFDSGSPAAVAEILARWVVTVLCIPVLPLLERVPALRLPGLFGYIPFVANAALWGLAAVAIRRRWHALASRRRQAHA